MLDYTYLFFETMAFLTSLFQFSKIKQTNYSYFIPYLLIIMIYEIGSFFNWFSINHTNLWISNFIMTFSFIFYSFFLLKILDGITTKKWIKGLIFLSIFFSLINNLFIQGFWKLNTASLLLQYGLLIMITCLYFYQLMNSTEKLVVIKLPAFWLNTGVMFFCLVLFLFYSVFDLAYKNNENYNRLFYVISNIANAILYSCLTVSFLCFNKTSNC